MKTITLFIILLTLGCTSREVAPEQQEVAPEQTAPAESGDQTEAQSIVNPEIQNGDLIFHTSTSDQSMAIQLATNSIYSHVGIIYKEGEETLVYEAVQPIKMTPLKAFIARGKDGTYVVKRLKQNDLLTEEGIKRMKAAGKPHMGKNYDLQFEWSDDRIYCSELVWKIYKEAFGIEIGELQQIKDFDLSDPIVKAKMKERYGNNVPMDEWVITPDRMFQSDKLVTVMEN